MVPVNTCLWGVPGTLPEAGASSIQTRFYRVQSLVRSLLTRCWPQPCWRRGPGLLQGLVLSHLPRKAFFEAGSTPPSQTACNQLASSQQKDGPSRKVSGGREGGSEGTGIQAGQEVSPQLPEMQVGEKGSEEDREDGGCQRQQCSSRVRKLQGREVVSRGEPQDHGRPKTGGLKRMGN